MDSTDEGKLSSSPHADPRLVWRPATSPLTAANDVVYGYLEAAGDQYLAAAVGLPLGNQPGFLAARRPMTEIDAEAAQLVRPLGLIGITTWGLTCVPICIVIYLVVKRFHDQLDGIREKTAGEIHRQACDLVRTRDAVIFGLARLAESRDTETGNHLERISSYATTLAAAMRDQPRYRHDITPGFMSLIGISSALHDIGKVGLPDQILLKPEQLTADEQAQMRVHTSIGGRCLQEIERRLGNSNFLQMAREIALWHHERWDGNGYPDRLKGETIPLSARIVAIADAYDALCSRRVYKDPYPHEQCAAIVRAEAGKHFDPDIVAVWNTIEHKFKEIAQRYRNASAPPAPARPTAGEEPEQADDPIEEAMCLAEAR